LSLFGYEANMEQSPESLTGIRALISLIPSAGSILCAVLIIFYALDDKFMAILDPDGMIHTLTDWKGADAAV